MVDNGRPLRRKWGMSSIVTTANGRSSMDRRKFFEQVAAWSAGLCAATPVFNVPPSSRPRGNRKGNPLLTVAKGKTTGHWSRRR